MPGHPLPRRGLLLAALPFGFDPGERFEETGRALGWVVLRDRLAAPGVAPKGGTREGAADALGEAIMLLRAERPVPPAERPGRLAASLRHFRPFHFGALPAEQATAVGGYPAAVIEAPATGAPGGRPLMVRAMRVDAPGRSLFVIGAVPAREWAALRPAVLAVMASVRP